MSNVYSDFVKKCEQNLSSEEIKIIDFEIKNIILEENIDYSVSKTTNTTFEASTNLNSFFDKILNRLMKESSISSKLHLLS